MFRRFYLPNFARSIRILCYEGSLVRKFESCVLYAVTMFRMITSQFQLLDANGCVCPKVTWGRTPAPWIEVHIFVNKGWKSVKLIDKEKAIKLLICGDSIDEVCDIIDIKQRHYFTTKWALSPIGEQKAHTLGWNAHPLLSDPGMLINVDILFLITRISFLLQLYSYYIVKWSTWINYRDERCLCKYLTRF